MAVNVPTIRRWSATTLALLLVAGTLAACGSSSSDKSSSSTGTGSSASQDASSNGYGTSAGSESTGGGAMSGGLALSPVEKGEDHFAFSKSHLTAKAGTVTIKVENASSNEYPHGIAIEGNGVDKDGKIAQPGGTSTVSVKLKPGTYTYYCPVPEHEKYGMKGTLTVQ